GGRPRRRPLARAAQRVPRDHPRRSSISRSGGGDRARPVDASPPRHAGERAGAALRPEAPIAEGTCATRDRADGSNRARGRRAPGRGSGSRAGHPPWRRCSVHPRRRAAGAVRAVRGRCRAAQGTRHAAGGAAGGSRAQDRRPGTWVRDGRRAGGALPEGGAARRGLSGGGEVKVALVHDWLTGLRGGERVLEQLCLLYPEADIFTLIYVPGTCGPIIERHRIRASFLDRLPKRSYRHYLPLFPVAIESFDLSAYELVISTSHAVAKGCRPGKHAVHVAYIHTPMRYVWDQFDAYFGEGRAGTLTRIAAAAVAPVL